jgi:hypothetical protein
MISQGPSSLLTLPSSKEGCLVVVTITCTDVLCELASCH